MKKLIVFILFGLLLYTCGEKAMMEDEHAHDDHDHAHEEGIIELTPEQMQNIGIVFDSMERRAIRSMLKLSGRVELPPSGMAVVTTPIPGRIMDVLIEPGEYVRKGQKLFSVFNMELIDWQRSYLQEKADLEFLEIEVERLKNLAAEKLTAEKNYQKIQADLKAKKVAMMAMSQRLRTVGIDADEGNGNFRSTFYVLASQSGKVEHLNINSGAYVEPTATLVEIINDDNLHLHLLAYGQQFDLIAVGQELFYNVISRPDDIRTATIKWINNVVNENTNSYDIHAEIDQLGGIIAGEFVEARILSNKDSVLSIPIQAVTHDRGLQYVFVLDGADSHGTHFRKKQIQTGVEDLGYVEVIPVDPIQAQEKIVTEGAFFLMAENKKQEMGEAGHSHAH